MKTPNWFIAFSSSALIFLVLAQVSSAAPATGTDRSKLTQELNEFYRLKPANPAEAKSKLESILKAFPENAVAHAEMGYLLMAENKHEEALAYFRTAQQLSPDDPQLALQLGYLLESTNRKKEAYREFEKASSTSNTSIQEQACLATIYLANVMRKKLPEPYFSDIYFSPSYGSRFDNGLFSLQWRAGMNVGARKEWDVYVGFRGTRDTESNGGTAPEIFSDNAGILAVGARYIPFHAVPLSIYGEAGRGYDLIDRGRNRWRDDFRAGALFYDVWGAGPNCSSDWSFPFKHVGNAYADLGVYSRYDRNWIGTARVREGLRLIEKNRSAVDGYLYLSGTVDANDEFFNNLVEAGPGLSFIPDHRWNVVFRFLAVKGNYLKVNGPSRNPHGRSYDDRRWEAECYWRF